jgi:hypothetical protein
MNILVQTNLGDFDKILAYIAENARKEEPRVVKVLDSHQPNDWVLIQVNTDLCVFKSFVLDLLNLGAVLVKDAEIEE